ncbi:MAG: ACP S-malonyltransferase [Clostridiales bacterium]|nr:ACP S-malonyltransferase [Clostridiales bacterium]
MGKIAFVFPGQGAQYLGMARDFYEQCPGSREIFRKATEAVGFSIEELCFEDEERLHQTRYTQPALLTASCAILKAIEDAGIHPDMTAGLSLGEYCALTAAGGLDFREAVQVVASRGRYMEEEVPNGKGAMTAVLYRRELPMEEICAAVDGTVVVANYNCPGQRVISGEKEAVEIAAKKLLEAGAARCVPLKVSGPFHSPMLKGAGEKLYERLGEVEIKRPVIPFISNVTAEPVQDPAQIRELLGRQVCSSVRWEQSVRRMIADGADTFVEIGPGRTLTGFMKKIDRSVKTFNVEKTENLEQLKAAVLE